jgi:hypothetical protein
MRAEGDRVLVDGVVGNKVRARDELNGSGDFVVVDIDDDDDDDDDNDVEENVPDDNDGKRDDEVGANNEFSCESASTENGASNCEAFRGDMFNRLFEADDDEESDDKLDVE